MTTTTYARYLTYIESMPAGSVTPYTAAEFAKLSMAHLLGLSVLIAQAAK